MLPPTGKGPLIAHSLGDLSVSKPLSDKSLSPEQFLSNLQFLLNGNVGKKTLNSSFFPFFSFFLETHVVTMTVFDNTGCWKKKKKERRQFMWLLCNIQFNSKEKKIKTYCKDKKNARIHTKHTLKRQLFTNILHYKNLILKFFLWAVFRWNYILNWALSIYLHFSVISFYCF